MSGKGVRAALAVLAVAAALAVTGCPEPFQFAGGGAAGSQVVDPSTPSITATPVFGWSSSGGSGTLQDGGSVATNADTAVTPQSGTTGALIYYTTDGSAPDPHSSSTSKFTSGSPIMVAISSPSSTNSSITVTIKAVAIGPNMMPSQAASVTITVQYPQASAPTFTPGGGFYTTDQTVTLSSATSGSTIYYTIVSGTGPAPTPQPGQAGTSQYSGGILLSGSGNTWTISAIAVHSQMLSSTAVSATFTVDYLTNFSTITPAEIATAVPQMTTVSVDNSNGNRIPVGTIFLYVTSSGHLGKMVITNNNVDGNFGLGFQFTTYNADGTVLASNANAVVNGTWLFDLDFTPSGTEDSTQPGFQADFWAENNTSTNRFFVPQNNAKFFQP